MRSEELNKPKDISINSQSELEIIFQVNKKNILLNSNSSKSVF